MYWEYSKDMFKCLPLMKRHTSGNEQLQFMFDSESIYEDVNVQMLTANYAFAKNNNALNPYLDKEHNKLNASQVSDVIATMKRNKTSLSCDNLLREYCPDEDFHRICICCPLSADYVNARRTEEISLIGYIVSNGGTVSVDLDELGIKDLPSLINSYERIGYGKEDNVTFPYPLLKRISEYLIESAFACATADSFWEGFCAACLYGKNKECGYGKMDQTALRYCKNFVYSLFESTVTKEKAMEIVSKLNEPYAYDPPPVKNASVPKKQNKEPIEYVEGASGNLCIRMTGKTLSDVTNGSLRDLSEILDVENYYIPEEDEVEEKTSVLLYTGNGDDCQVYEEVKAPVSIEEDYESLERFEEELASMAGFDTDDDYSEDTMISSKLNDGLMDNILEGNFISDIEDMSKSDVANEVSENIEPSEEQTNEEVHENIMTAPEETVSEELPTNEPADTEPTNDMVFEELTTEPNKKPVDVLTDEPISESTDSDVNEDITPSECTEEIVPLDEPQEPSCDSCDATEIEGALGVEFDKTEGSSVNLFDILESDKPKEEVNIFDLFAPSPTATEELIGEDVSDNQDTEPLVEDIESEPKEEPTEDKSDVSGTHEDVVSESTDDTEKPLEEVVSDTQDEFTTVPSDESISDDNTNQEEIATDNVAIKLPVMVFNDSHPLENKPKEELNVTHTETDSIKGVLFDPVYEACDMFEYGKISVIDASNICIPTNRDSEEFIKFMTQIQGKKTVPIELVSCNGNPGVLVRLENMFFAQYNTDCFGILHTLFNSLTVEKVCIDMYSLARYVYSYDSCFNNVFSLPELCSCYKTSGGLEHLVNVITSECGEMSILKGINKYIDIFEKLKATFTDEIKDAYALRRGFMLSHALSSDAGFYVDGASIAMSSDGFMYGKHILSGKPGMLLTVGDICVDVDKMNADTYNLIVMNVFRKLNDSYYLVKYKAKIVYVNDKEFAIYIPSASDVYGFMDAILRLVSSTIKKVARCAPRYSCLPTFIN